MSNSLFKFTRWVPAMALLFAFFPILPAQQTQGLEQRWSEAQANAGTRAALAGRRYFLPVRRDQ